MALTRTSDGKVAIKSVEIFASARCNLRCEHCAASSPYVHEHHYPDLSVLESTLRTLSLVMHSAQAKVLGGEPLLNPELPELLATIRRSGFADRIRVCTNGALLGRMSDPFWEEADVVEVSLYPGAPGSPTPDELSAYAARAAEFGATFESNEITHFQESIVTHPIGDAEVVQQIYDACHEAHVWPCHALEGTRFLLCSRVHNLERRLEALGHRDLALVEEAGFPVSDRPSLMQDLERYMSRTVPFRACDYCLGTSGTRQPNRQLAAGLTNIRKKDAERRFSLRSLDFESSPLVPTQQPAARPDEL